MFTDLKTYASEKIKRDCFTYCISSSISGKSIVLVGVEDVDGFESVALGELVDYKKVEPGLVKLAKETLKQNPYIRAFLFECTELSAYSDSVRKATGLPVFDIITTSDFIINSFR